MGMNQHIEEATTGKQRGCMKTILGKPVCVTCTEIFGLPKESSEEFLGHEM
jgi:hypothetical protein